MRDAMRTCQHDMVADQARSVMSGDHETLHRAWPDAARRLGVGKTKIFELIASGELESVKVGRLRRVPESAIIEYIARLRAQR